MLYTEGEKTDPRAGDVLARLVNPTTELDVRIEDAHVSGTGPIAARIALVLGGIRSTVRIITQASEPLRDGGMVVRLGQGDAIELVAAADATGIVVGSFRCGQFEYPCAKPYGVDRPIQMPQHNHDLGDAAKKCQNPGDPKSKHPCPAFFTAYTDPVDRDHCEKPAGHEHRGDATCGPLKARS